jgi:hypothetical protein
LAPDGGRLGYSGLVSSATRLFSCAAKFLQSKTRLAIGHSSSTRRIFVKSICKCRRCVAKRRIRFLTVLGICIAMAAGCYVLVDHSKPGVPPSSNAQEAPAEEPTLDANAIPEGKPKPLSMAATQPGTSWKQQDTKTAREPGPRPRSTP